MVLYGWQTGAGPFERLRREMNRVFDRSVFARGPMGRWLGRGARFPRINLTETEDALLVACELPGVGKEDVDIAVEHGVLTIRGEVKPVEGRTPENYHRRERATGPFERAVELPAKVDTEKVSAKLADGILEITLPKTPEEKPRTIEVKHK